MRKLLMVLVPSALLLAACGGDDGGTPTPGAIHLTWAITQGGAAATCADVGAVQTDILSTNSAQQGFDDIFVCDDLEGTTDPLAPDDYVVVCSLLDSGGVAITSLAPVNVTIGEGETVDVTCVFDL